MASALSIANMSIVKQLAGETAIYGLSTILSKILHFVLLTPYLTRVFRDQSEYGIYSDLYAYAAFLIILFTYRMETGYFRFGTKTPNQESITFSTSVLSHLFTTVFLVGAILVFRQPIASLLAYDGQPQFVSYFALIIGLDAIVAIPFAQLRLRNKALNFALIKVAHTVLNLLLIFFLLEGCPMLIRAGFDWWGKIYSYDTRLQLIFIANLIASASVALYFVPSFLNTQLVFSWSTFKKMISYSLPLLIVGLAGVFNQSSAVPLIKYLMPGTGEENLALGGIYGAAAKLAILMNLFTVAFNYAAEPFFFKKVGEADAKSTYAEIAQAFAMVASAGFLFINLFLDLFQYLIGPEYRSGIVVVPVLLLAYWFLGMYYNIAVWYKVTDKTRYGAMIAVTGSMITLVIAVLFLKSHGIMAMAIATLACYASMVFLGYITGQYHFKIRYPVRKILGYLLLAVLLTAIGQILNRQEIPFAWRTFLKLGLLLTFGAGSYYLDRNSFGTWFSFKSRT